LLVHLIDAVIAVDDRLCSNAKGGECIEDAAESIALPAGRLRLRCIPLLTPQKRYLRHRNRDGRIRTDGFRLPKAAL
jgi:hypothetical protein